MKLVIDDTPTVTVITPTVGSPKLSKCMESVNKQTYKGKLIHYLVCDGRKFVNPFFQQVGLPPIYNIEHTILEFNTGKEGGNFYGHRIYAAFPHLLNTDYILFLDEDNWYEPDHVESLVRTAKEKNLDFSYSLRKIYSEKEEYLCDDNCESLGKWEIFNSRQSPHGKQYLIDTSSFCFKRDFIQKTCHLWHSGWGGDRKFFYAVKEQAKYDTNGKYTLCYRLDGNEGSVTEQFFVVGNKTQEAYYGGKFPWIKI